MPTRAQIRDSWRAWLAQDLQYRSPYWLQLVWTGLLALAVALLFTGVGFVAAPPSDTWTGLAIWWRGFQLNLLASAFVAYFVHALFELVGRLIGRERLLGLGRWQRTFYTAGLPLAGIALAWPPMLALLGLSDPALSSEAVSSIVLALVFALLVSLYLDGRVREEQAERRAGEARLRLLQAQIEPHFLFNTLANVLSLMERDTPKARRMLESFVDYLRSAVSSLGEREHTLGEELDLVEAYLRVVQIRMEQRLSYAIDVPEALRAQPLPALTLQPLVENAVVHGLEPKIEGGRLRIAAALQDGRLNLLVEDDGLGLRNEAPSGGTGTALRNIRERLRSLHGDAAALSLEAAEPQGVRARLLLPLTPGGTAA